MKGRITRPNQEVTLDTGYPMIGRIKTGYKDEKTGFPKSIDYFLADSQYKALFDSMHGEKPTILQIMFPSDDPNVSCQEVLELWDKDGKKFAFGDGEHFKVWNGKEYSDRYIKDNPNLMDEMVDYLKGNRGWITRLKLRFLLPKLGRIKAYWQYETSGKASTIPKIRNTFDAFLRDNGSVSGVIFDLTVTFAKSKKPGTKSRFPVVSLIPNMSIENVEMVKAALVYPEYQEQMDTLKQLSE